MRFLLALLLVAFASAPAAAQQPRPSQPAKPSQQAPVNPPAQSGQASQPGRANPFNELPSAKPSQAEEVMRQRILLREKFNKGWDVQNEDPREKRARCKSEARKKFTAMHPLKRRSFQKECMAKAGR